MYTYAEFKSNWLRTDMLFLILVLARLISRLSRSEIMLLFSVISALEKSYAAI
jgi:hypothetical protein